MFRAIAFLVTLSVVATKAVDYTARGLPEQVAWHNFEEGTALAKVNGKPVVVLFTKPWCGACKNLKQQFTGAKSFFELSKKFNMVNIEEDNEVCYQLFKAHKQDPTDGQNWTPQGGYIPRTFFLTPDGKIDQSVTGPNDQYPNFFASPSALEDAMKSFLEKQKSEL